MTKYLHELMLQHVDFICHKFLLQVVLPEAFLKSLVLPLQILNGEINT